MERSWEFIPAETIEQLAAGLGPDRYASDWMTDTDAFAYAEELCGKKLHLDFTDGAAADYDFAEKKRLQYSENGQVPMECFYRAIPAPGYPGILFVQHYHDGKVPAACTNLVLDLERGYVTRVQAVLGTGSNPREVQHEISFGRVTEGPASEVPGTGEKTAPPAFTGVPADSQGEAPCFTTELVGKAILWHMPAYTNKPPIKHIYLSPEYYGIRMTRDDECYMTADPADYVRIRDDLYLVSIVEKRRSGIQLTFLINTSLLQDVVGHFGISTGNEPGQDKAEIICTVMTGRQGEWSTLQSL